jgi:hypothetical protein
MLPYCIFLAFIIIRYAVGNNFIFKKNIRIYIQIAAAVFIPLAIGIIWVYWTDHVKTVSGFEALTSKALQTWHFGSMLQKFSPENWNFIYTNMKRMGINPLTALAALLICIPALWKKRKEFLLACIPVLCSIATIFVLFNLYYIHDYYYCAILPLLCMTGAYAAYNLFSFYANLILPDNILKNVITMAAVIATLFIFWHGDPYIKRTVRDAQYYKEYKGNLLDLAEYIKTNTKKDDLIMVFDNDWNSEIPYNAQRKALMPLDWLHKDSYTAVANDYELFIMNKSSELQSNRLAILPEMILETTIGDWNVYRKQNAKNLLYRQRRV